jgi:hypothetical protein
MEHESSKAEDYFNNYAKIQLENERAERLKEQEHAMKKATIDSTKKRIEFVCSNGQYRYFHVLKSIEAIS